MCFEVSTLFQSVKLNQVVTFDVDAKQWWHFYFEIQNSCLKGWPNWSNNVFLLWNETFEIIWYIWLILFLGSDCTKTNWIAMNCQVMQNEFRFTHIQKMFVFKLYSLDKFELIQTKNLNWETCNFELLKLFQNIK